jgi:hypothetical protein
MPVIDDLFPSDLIAYLEWVGHALPSFCLVLMRPRKGSYVDPQKQRR